MSAFADTHKRRVHEGGHFSLAANKFAFRAIKTFRLSKGLTLMSQKIIRSDKIEIYIHFIWTTFDRRPWLTPAIEVDLFPIIVSLGARHGCKTLALNGVPDHLHWLVKYSSTTRTCDVAKDAKGNSSEWMGRQIEVFKWRPTYAAFSVSKWNVRKICAYIERQKQHHADNTTIKRLESEDELLEIADGE